MRNHKKQKKSYIELQVRDLFRVIHNPELVEKIVSKLELMCKRTITGDGGLLAFEVYNASLKHGYNKEESKRHAITAYRGFVEYQTTYRNYKNYKK
jgi:hypothetical protein